MADTIELKDASVAPTKGSRKAAATTESRFKANLENKYKAVQAEYEKLIKTTSGLSSSTAKFKKRLDDLEKFTDKFERGFRDATGALFTAQLSGAMKGKITKLKNIGLVLEAVIGISNDIERSLNKLGKAGRGSSSFVSAFKDLNEAFRKGGELLNTNIPKYTRDIVESMIGVMDKAVEGIVKAESGIPQFKLGKAGRVRPGGFTSMSALPDVYPGRIAPSMALTTTGQNFGFGRGTAPSYPSIDDPRSRRFIMLGGGYTPNAPRGPASRGPGGNYIPPPGGGGPAGPGGGYMGPPTYGPPTMRYAAGGAPNYGVPSPYFITPNPPFRNLGTGPAGRGLGYGLGRAAGIGAAGLLTAGLLAPEAFGALGAMGTGLNRAISPGDETIEALRKAAISTGTTQKGIANLISGGRPDAMAVSKIFSEMGYRNPEDAYRIFGMGGTFRPGQRFLQASELAANPLTGVRSAEEFQEMQSKAVGLGLVQRPGELEKWKSSLIDSVRKGTEAGLDASTVMENIDRIYKFMGATGTRISASGAAGLAAMGAASDVPSLRNATAQVQMLTAYKGKMGNILSDPFSLMLSGSAFGGMNVSAGTIEKRIRGMGFKDFAIPAGERKRLDLIASGKTAFPGGTMGEFFKWANAAGRDPRIKLATDIMGWKMMIPGDDPASREFRNSMILLTAPDDPGTQAYIRNMLGIGGGRISVSKSPSGFGGPGGGFSTVPDSPGVLRDIGHLKLGFEKRTKYDALGITPGTRISVPPGMEEMGAGASRVRAAKEANKEVSSAYTTLSKMGLLAEALSDAFRGISDLIRRTAPDVMAPPESSAVGRSHAHTGSAGAP